jgi:hypothetical protein
LEEIANDNTSAGVLQQIEHFQNQLIIHSNIIDELSKLININMWSIECQLTEANPFVDESLANENEKLNTQYKTEEKMINDLRHEFNRFAAEWM